MADESGPDLLGGLDGLLGSSAQPGGAGGLDLAAATDAVRRLLADREAMTALNGFIADGSDLRTALERTAGAVPLATGPIDTLLANPGILEDLGGSLAGLLGGASSSAASPEGIDLPDAGSMLGRLLGGER